MALLPQRSQLVGDTVLFAETKGGKLSVMGNGCRGSPMSYKVPPSINTGDCRPDHDSTPSLRAEASKRLPSSLLLPLYLLAKSYPSIVTGSCARPFC